MKIFFGNLSVLVVLAYDVKIGIISFFCTFYSQ